MRDLSRYRARSASALAATSLAVLIAMMIAVVATGRYADVLDYFGPNLPSNQLVVYAPGSSPGNVSGIAVTAAKLAAFDARVAIVAASVGTRDVLLLDGTDGGGVPVASRNCCPQCFRGAAGPELLGRLLEPCPGQTSGTVLDFLSWI
jgi:hypothetical protein